MGPPVIDRSNVERENPRLVYPYKGKCLACGVNREGYYGTYFDEKSPHQASPASLPHPAWLFSK